MSGFGVRVRLSGAKTFVLIYRLGGKLCKHTMGKPVVGYGVAEARERAADLLRGLRDGIDPQQEKVADRSALTVAQLADLYLEEGPALKPNTKASSCDTDRTVFECHVKPLLGRRLARDLFKIDVAKFQMDVASGKTARNIKTGHRRRSRVTGGKRVASMSVAILGAAYQFGIEIGALKANPT